MIVLLNGAPRAGKSSIAEAMRLAMPGRWAIFGVDIFIREVLPPELRPGIGLRPFVPGDEEVAARLGPEVPRLYRAFHDSISALDAAGMDVIADVGYHDGYAQPVEDARRAFAGRHVLFVGVHCAIEAIMARRRASSAGVYLDSSDGSIPPAVALWQYEVHRGRSYDVEVDTTSTSADECAAKIIEALPRSVNRVIS